MVGYFNELAVAASNNTALDSQALSEIADRYSMRFLDPYRWATSDPPLVGKVKVRRAWDSNPRWVAP